MVKTIHLTADIPPSREVLITLPADVPPGPADIVIVVAPRGLPTSRTLGELLASDFFGMWQDRDDIQDSADFARRLRQDAWSRPE